MTLRRRLLLVYLIVVLLSVATVGAAMFELSHARQIIRHLQDWNKIVLNVQKLRTSFPPLPGEHEQVDLREDLAEQYAYLTGAPADLDVDQVRDGLNRVHQRYTDWLALPDAKRAVQTEPVTASIENLSWILEGELAKLNTEADRQEIRAHLLLALVIVMTAVHVAVVGSLLRRWLLHPMERLNRQVSALARDEPPPEPILTQPREMANLARALDDARRSLGVLRKKLIDAERLTTIGQLAAQLAHNLRNPLASIRATAQLAARSASKGSAQEADGARGGGGEGGGA